MVVLVVERRVLVAAGRAHRRPGAGHLHAAAPYWGAGAWPSPPRKGAKVKTLVQALAVGTALWPGGAPGRHGLAGAHACSGIAVVLTLVTGVAVRPGGQPAEHDRRPARARHGVTRPRRKAATACAVRSSRSAPSCCSARSSTPTRRWIGEQLALTGHRLHLPDQGRRQPGPHRAPPCEHALERADAVIVCGGLGPDPGRHHPRRHRRGHGRAARAGDDGRRGQDPGHVRRPGPGHAGQQPAPGRRARGGHGHGPAARHRPGPDLPDRRQGRSTPCPACPTR